MATTTVSDAVILPQSQGTGLSGENATIDAAINGVLNRYVGGEYVSSEYSTGLAFQNHNASNDTVEVGPGIVFVQDNSTSTSGERGSGSNPQAESSTTSGYDTELPEGHTYAVLLPTATQISVSDSTLNEVHVDIDDVTANNSVNLEHDGSSTASPGSTSLKIGETNPDNASADTRANDDASPTFDTLTVNGTTDTDALNATSLTIDGAAVEKVAEFTQSGATSNTVTANFGTNDIDENKLYFFKFKNITPQGSGTVNMYFDGDDAAGNANYGYFDETGTEQTGTDKIELVDHGAFGNIQNQVRFFSQDSRPNIFNQLIIQQSALNGYAVRGGYEDTPSDVTCQIEFTVGLNDGATIELWEAL